MGVLLVPARWLLGLYLSEFGYHPPFAEFSQEKISTLADASARPASFHPGATRVALNQRTRRCCGHRRDNPAIGTPHWSVNALPTEAAAPDFHGLRVASFESRRAQDMVRMIERFRGVPAVSPSMRETPLEDHREAIDFANRLISGQIDVVILQTGVGTRQLAAQIERHVDKARFLTALTDVTTIARGPKPVVALKELDIRPSFIAPEPNTWREVLQTIDLYVPVANLTVAVQEYGNPNVSLVAGLEARGARVAGIKVYSYDLPADTRPLEANTRAIAAGQIDLALFTSAHQVTNLLRMARQLGLVDELRQGFRKTVVASIGPTTTEMLQEHELPVDLEPEHPKMGHLVSEAAAASGMLVARKRGKSTPAGAAFPPLARLARDE